MNVKEFRQYLDYLFQSNVTPLVWGIHGIGKSTVPQQYADDGGHKLFNLRLGNMEIGDVLGLPDFLVEGDAYKGKDKKKVATAFMKPDWLHELFAFAEANPDKYAIIFLDEINRVRKDMLNPVFQMAIDRRLHTYKFPANVRVIAAANPPIDNGKDMYWVNDFTESALLDRFCHLKFNPTVGEWVDFAEKTGVNTDWRQFIQDQPMQLHATKTDFSIDEYCRPSNRSTEAAARLYDIQAPKELIYGCVGSSTGAAFYQWVEENRAKRISADDVMNGDYKAIRDRVKKLVDGGRIGELKTTLNEIEKICKEKSETGPEYDLAIGTNICKFLNDLPIDVVYKSAMELCTYNAICRQISTVDDDDKRKMPEQQKLFKRLEDALKSGEIDRTELDGKKAS